MEDVSFQTPSILRDQSPRRPRRFVVLVFVLLLIALIVFLIMRFGTQNQRDSTANISPTPTEIVFPTDAPSPSPATSPTAVVTPSPSVVPTTSPLDKATGLNRASLSVAVQNGSGVAGGASKASDTLKSLGYKVVSIGNADNFNYEDVTIQVKASVAKYLPLLKSDLSKQYTVGSTSETLSASSSADAVVIVGK